ncbi:MAG TPA: hypothetical protein V6C76_16710 [Drouetiella sp.]
MGNNLSNPEQTSLRTGEPQTPADSTTHQNLLKEFVNSSAYSALEQPSLGVAQLVGKDATAKVTNFFNAVGVEAPQADSTTSGWTAQTLGGAVGMLLPFALTKGALKKVGVLGEAGAAESGLLQSRSAIGLTMKEAAVTGFAYGSILTPSKDTDSTGTLIADRLLGGTGTALTMSTLTAGSLGLGRLAETDAVARLGLAPVVKNPFFSGVVAGLPGGAVSAEYDSLTKKHSFASASELGESMASMALVGGAFGGLEVAKPHAARAGSFIADNLRSSFRTFDLTPNLRLGSGAEHDSVGPKPPESNASDPNRSLQNLDEASANKDAKVEAPPPVLNAEQQAVLNQISRARTFDEFRESTRQIDNVEDSAAYDWLTERLDSQAKSLSTAELKDLWPKLVEADNDQSQRIIRSLGPARATEVWQSALESVRQTDNPALKNELGRTVVLVEPSAQLNAIQSLLNLENPPSSVSLAPSYIAKQNQIPAARMLLEHGVTPFIELARSTSLNDWSKFIYDTVSGGERATMLGQLAKRASNFNATADEVNTVYRDAQSKATDQDYAPLRNMMAVLEKDSKPAEEIAANREKAYENVDPKFLARLQFSERDWHNADQLAQLNPELVKALAQNSDMPKMDAPSLYRSEFIANLMKDGTVSPDKLAESLSSMAQSNLETRRSFPLSYGDLTALAEHGTKVPPDQLSSVLGKLRDDTLQAFDMKGTGEQAISQGRLLSDLTLAYTFAKDNPALLQSEFKGPIEAVMGDNSVSYERRLLAARALGELQRRNLEATFTLHMPDLRMGKFADLTPEDQKLYRDAAEAGLTDRSKMEQLIGDGPLGRLMPEVLGNASEGGIVGRRQHAVHDNTVDVHLLDVLEKAGQDPRFKSLLPQDQVNTLWASFLHDISKRENMVDLDHSWTSTSTAWGILRTLGYPDTQIQRITDIMGRDFDLSYDPESLNSTRFQNDPKALDDVVAAYRKPGALDAVSILNASDIQSVKKDGSWYTPEVIAELDKIRSMAQDRVKELNKHLLPVMTTEMPKGFGISESSDYNVMVHRSPDLTGQLLRQRSTIESPENSMSVSLISPEHQKLYSDTHNTDTPIVAIIDGPFEHISQAHRRNISTGRAAGWNEHVELIRRWADDSRGRQMAQEAEAKLESLGIPPDRDTPAENYPRLAQMRKILSNFDTLNELEKQAGSNNEYVVGAKLINNMLMSDANGNPLAQNNEIKINNPILSGIGIVHKTGEPIYFEGVPRETLQHIWNGQIPDYVRTVEPGKAPEGSVVVPMDVVESAYKQKLPIVILNGNGHQ